METVISYQNDCDDLRLLENDDKVFPSIFKMRMNIVPSIHPEMFLENMLIARGYGTRRHLRLTR